MNRQLAGLCDKRKALNTNEIADVEQLFEYGVVECCILALAHIVAADIDLDSARVVLNLEERRATHNSAAHNTACNANVLIVILFGVEILLNFSGGCRYIEHLCGVGINAQRAQLCERVTSQLFLFAKFKCHSVYLVL